MFSFLGQTRFNRRESFFQLGKSLPGPVDISLHRQTLDLDFGLTWTDESFVAGGSESGFGGLAGLAWSYRFGETATLRERALWYPNFESGGDWRLTSETALEAGLTARWALKLGLLVRYDHHPVPGFETTDTTTTASLVWKL